MKKTSHRPDCLCAQCTIAPLRAQPRSASAAAAAAELEAYEPARIREVTIKATDRKPPCITCARERGDVSPHRADYEARDKATGLVLSYTCERGIVALLARALLASLALVMLACSGAGSDAGELELERDASHIVDLIDAAGDAGELEDLDAAGDAGELEDLDAAGDAGELDAAGDGDGDAGELELDAGDASDLRPCASASELRLCRSADCGSELCRSATSILCCERSPGSAPHCACEAP